MRKIWFFLKLCCYYSCWMEHITEYLKWILLGIHTKSDLKWYKRRVQIYMNSSRKKKRKYNANKPNDKISTKRRKRERALTVYKNEKRKCWGKNQTKTIKYHCTRVHSNVNLILYECYKWLNSSWYFVCLSLVFSYPLLSLSRSSFLILFPFGRFPSNQIFAFGQIRDISYNKIRFSAFIFNVVFIFFFSFYFFSS